jgi:hypothetical protein
MNRKTTKALLENGVLQSWANGEEVQLKVQPQNIWETWHEYNFDSEPECYRIKPKPRFKEGDLVKVEGYKDIYTIKEISQHNNCRIEPENRSSFSMLGISIDKLIPVQKILKAHTFETAVKALAQYGFELKQGFSSRTVCGFREDGSILWMAPGKNFGASDYTSLTAWYHDQSTTPFAQIEYKKIL